ncbi:hypothetical protein [Peijinzhouia sedimentorum]
MKKPKKSFWIAMVSVFILSLAVYYYSRPVLVYMPSDSAGDCTWGYEAVEVSRIPFLNSQMSKFCDCTETPLFLANGNHIPCGSKEE